jgi:hypothetical protein
MVLIFPILKYLSYYISRTSLQRFKCLVRNMKVTGLRKSDKFYV